jgi:dienelactone hydrolase
MRGRSKFKRGRARADRARALPFGSAGSCSVKGLGRDGAASFTASRVEAHFPMKLPHLIVCSAFALNLLPGQLQAAEPSGVAADVAQKVSVGASVATAEVVLENGGTGAFPAIATEEATLPGMTLFRPRDLAAFGPQRPLPVLLWGNGACANTTQEHKNFLNELASHGYLILGIGPLSQIDQRDERSRERTQSSQLIHALDWILTQATASGGRYAGKIAVSKVAAMGMSCGGLQAIEISADPRITTSVICNSGVLPAPSTMKMMPALTKEDLRKYHAPVLYIIGGPKDIAYNNAMDDFSRVNHVPIVMTNFDVGHGGTYGQPHGGEFTRVALAWLNWQLKGNTDAGRQFLDAKSELRTDPKWTVELKNFAQP